MHRFGPLLDPWSDVSAAGSPSVDVTASTPEPAEASFNLLRVNPQYLDMKYDGMFDEPAVLSMWHKRMESALALFPRLSSSPDGESALSARFQTAILDVLSADLRNSTVEQLRLNFNCASGLSDPSGATAGHLSPVPEFVSNDRRALARAFFRLSQVLAMEQADQGDLIRQSFENRCLAVLGATGLRLGRSDALEHLINRHEDTAQFRKALSVVREIAEQSEGTESELGLSEERREAILAMRARLIGCLSSALVSMDLDGELSAKIIETIGAFGAQAGPAIEYLLEDPAPTRHELQLLMIQKLGLELFSALRES